MISGVNKWIYNDNKRSQLTDISAISKFSSSIKNTVKYVFLNNNSFSSIECLGDLKNIYELDVMCNSKLLNLNGLENHTNLVYVFAQKCNLQNINGLENTPELFGLCILSNINLKSINGIENSKKIDHIEAGGCDIIELSALQDNSKVRYLALQYNVNLESIIALKNCTGLRKLFLAGNINMIGTEVRDALADPTTHILQNCGATYNIPSKYNIYFTTLTSYDYSNLGLTDDSDEINSLKNKTNVTRLNLSGNPNLSNSKLQEILSTMTGLKALSLNGCVNLETIEFVGENKVDKLVELDLRGTSKKLIDLSNLNNNKTLITLLIDNTQIDLTKIQDLINNISDVNKFYSKYEDSIASNGYWWAARGIALYGNLSEYSLENCSKITNWAFGISVEYGNQIKGVLDLSKLTNLKSFKNGATSIPVKLPKSLQYLDYCVGKNLDLSECTNLISISFSNNTKSKNFDIENYNINSAYLKNVETAKGCSKNLKFLKNANNLDISITIGEAADGVDFLESLEGLPVKAKSLNISRAVLLENVDALKNENNLETLSINNTEKISKIDLSGCLNLTTLNLTNGNISEVKGLEKITNLTKAYLNNNKITDIASIKESKNLVKLNLNSNNLTDISILESLIDENGKTKLQELQLSDNLLQTVSINGHNNVETLKKLYNAGLRTLDISGNNFTAGSTDELKNLKWTSYKE